MSKFYDRYWLTKKMIGNDFRYKWPVVKKYIPRKPDSKILDFGCGPGKIIEEMKEFNPTSSYTGVDVSEKIIAKNKKRLTDCKFHAVEDGEKLPFKSKFFDFIISTDAIEHIYDTELAFKELARVLKPGGKILITTPYHGLLKNLLIVILKFELIFDAKGAHIRFFTKRSLSSCLIEVGLKPIKFDYFGRFYPLSRGILVLAEKSDRD